MIHIFPTIERDLLFSEEIICEHSGCVKKVKPSWTLLKHYKFCAEEDILKR